VGVGLLSWGAIRLAVRNLKQIEPSPGFRVTQRIPVSDGLRLALGAPSTAGFRPVALIAGTGSAAQKLGGEILVKAEMPLQVRKDLGSLPVLWADQWLTADGPPKEVALPDGKAFEARGGEPNPSAWLIRPDGLLEVPKPLSLLAPAPKYPTMILVDLDWNVLWYFENGQRLWTARISSGRYRQGPAISNANWQVNYLTPRGEFKVELLQKGMAVPAENLPAGHPLNPYGSRWIGFSVLPGDKGSIWGIHGTPKPDAIGRWSTNGTVALRNEDVEAIYQRLKPGVPIVIRGGQ
jgi:hypothetical protein